jgi:hypothetical protein
MPMDAEIVRNWLMAINMLVSASVWLFVFLDRRQHATVETINKLEVKLETKLDDCRNRIAHLEGELKGTPNRQELVRMHERIDEVFQNIQTTQLMIGELSGQLKQMNHASKTL